MQPLKPMCLIITMWNHNSHSTASTSFGPNIMLKHLIVTLINVFICHIQRITCLNFVCNEYCLLLSDGMFSFFGRLSYLTICWSSNTTEYTSTIFLAGKKELSYINQSTAHNQIVRIVHRCFLYQYRTIQQRR